MTTNYGASERYQNEKGKEYLAYQQQAAPGAALEARKFAPHIRAADRVIDFGCGGGWILRQLKCAERVGVELNESAHGFCHENGVRVYRTLDDVEGGNFDVAISNHCLEHVPYPVEALRALRALMKTGGTLVLVVPLDDWRVQKDHTGSDIDHHLHTWTPRLLANTLAEAGFMVRSIKVLTYAWPPGWQTLMNVLPGPVFDAACWLTAAAKCRRQLLALASKP
jgi:2-polyprenyl-3-methyl-5-hydroxy-6-metoxy-1,4-benzoquinol methylase